MTARLNLGARHSIDGRTSLGSFEMPTHDLLTHGVITRREPLCACEASPAARA